MAGRMFQRDPEGGFASLFERRQVFWSYNTRVAIRAACDLLGVGPGTEILIPAYNCGSEIDPLIHAGATAQLYPVGEDLCVDPARIEPLITDRTRAVYVIHYFGMIQPELAALRELCDQRGLRLIEDCALSLLSGAAPAEGRIGDVSVFCFHKFVSVLEGGALVVNAPDLTVADPFSRAPPRRTVTKKLTRAALANVLGAGCAQRLMRTVRGRQNAPPIKPDMVSLDDIPGHYYFDPALQGARISAFASRPLQAFSVSQEISARRTNWAHYRRLLDGLAGVRILMPELSPETCPLNMPVMIANRDRVAWALQARGIGVTPWWAGFHRQLNWEGQDEAMRLKNGVLSLPLHPALGPAHLEYIVSKLKGARATSWSLGHGSV